MTGIKLNKQKKMLGRQEVADAKEAADALKTLNDEKTANNIKVTISNLESSSAKLDQNMEALKYNIFFRRYFKRR